MTAAGTGSSSGTVVGSGSVEPSTTANDTEVEYKLAVILVTGFGDDFANAGTTQEDASSVLTLEDLQLTLDVVGSISIPIVGEVADGLNVIIALSQGQWGNAAISAAGIIPVVGDVAKLAKAGKAAGLLGAIAGAGRRGPGLANSPGFQNGWDFISWGGRRVDDIAQEASRAVRWPNGIDALDGNRLVDSVRRTLGIADRQNIGLAEVVIDGSDRQLLTGVSGGAARPGTVPTPTDRIFVTRRTRGAQPTDVDSEVKLLENIAQGLRGDPRGMVNLFTEREPCPSCLGVIRQFRNRFPGIALNVTDGGR